jgi:predicted 3-demethylubiquinone-9 3-methyltransferase (glyoxalase superfamily)
MNVAPEAKVTPFLWFDRHAEEAARFYVDVFSAYAPARILGDHDYRENTPGEAGTVMTVEFELGGQRFIALNGGPVFAFTPAVSFQIDCESQAEVDHFWERLSDGGRTSQCGWLEDKFGLSWQVVPSVLPRLLRDDDDAKADAVMQAMLTMTKIEIAALQAAYDAA